MFGDYRIYAANKESTKSSAEKLDQIIQLLSRP